MPTAATVDDIDQQIRLDVGHRISCRRHELGLSQHALATRINTRPAELSRWENGHVLPRGESLRRLADALDTHWTALAYGQAELDT